MIEETPMNVGRLIHILRQYPEGAEVFVTWEGTVHPLRSSNIYKSMKYHGALKDFSEDNPVVLIDGDGNRFKENRFGGVSFAD